MNKVILMGRLTKDPDVRNTGDDSSKAVAKYTLAVGRHIVSLAKSSNCA